MASPGLKRSLDFEMAPHTGAQAETISFGSIANGTKRRCPEFSLQIRPNSHNIHHSSPFKEPSLLLTSPCEDIANMIKDEIHKASHDHHHYNSGHHAPLLTVRQAQIICEKLIREREQKLREEYEKTLITKLAEQHETFVKYTHDHIHKRYNDTNSHQASYLS